MPKITKGIGQLVGATKVTHGGGFKSRPADFRQILAAIDADEYTVNLESAALEEAERLRAIMAQSLVQQRGGGKRPFAPLSPATIALRRSVARKKKGGRKMGRKALIETAQMFKSIQVVRKGNIIFIGIPRNARRKSATGKDPKMMNLALLHEHGFVTQWTPKQSAWFWASIGEAHNAPANKILRARKKGGRSKGFSLIIVPPRPFIGPSVEAWQADLGRNLEKLLKPRAAGGVD